MSLSQHRETEWSRPGRNFQTNNDCKTVSFFDDFVPRPLTGLASLVDPPPLRDFRPPGFLHAMALSQMKLPGAANAGEAKKLTDNLALAIFLFLFIYLFKSKRAKRPLTLQWGTFMYIHKIQQNTIKTNTCMNQFLQYCHESIQINVAQSFLKNSNRWWQNNIVG